MWRWAGASLVLVWLALTGAAFAYDETAIVTAETEARTIQAELRRYTVLPRNPAITEEQVQAERTSLEDIQNRALTQSDALDTPLADVATQLDQLGAAPTDGTAEEPSITQQRNQLIGQLARLNAVQKLYGLIAVEAEQALTRLTVEQRDRFFERVFESGSSILDPRLWLNTGKGASLFASRMQNLAFAALRRAQSNLNWTPIVIFPAGLLLIWLVGAKFLPRLARSAGLVSAGTADLAGEGALLRLWRVVWGTLKVFLAVTIGYIFFIVTLQAMGLWSGETEVLSDFAIGAIGPSLIVAGFAYLVCAPFHPERRLVAIDDRAARIVPVLVGVASLVYFLGDEISKQASAFNLPVTFSIGQSAFIALLLIVLTGLIFLILRRQATLNLAAEGKAFFLTWFLKFMPVLWLLLAVAAMALLLGYIALSYFISGNLLMTGLAVTAFGVAHAFVDALAGALADPATRPGRILRSASGFSEQGVRRLVIMVRTVADAVLVLSAVVLLLILWTVVLFDISDIFTLMGRGLQIGNISLSLGTIAVALTVLMLGVFITRVVTGWLNRRVLAETQLDRGVQNSIQSAAGYAGYTLAAGLALSAAGLEFSNLAIVAGALGVGIGFGLQSIVNNFVSGLILLAERPVRVGDWIVTQTGEGIVKKINVRATEIDTFDNGTIIVPNSNLITNAVKNWTLRDTTGRFSVTLATVHGVDPDDIIEKLEALARAHPKVMRHPQAEATLTKILPNGIEFEVGGQVRDALDSGKVASDIRREIIKTFDKKILLVPAKPVEAK